MEKPDGITSLHIEMTRIEFQVNRFYTFFQDNRFYSFRYIYKEAGWNHLSPYRNDTD